MADATCSVPDCGKPIKRTGFCYAHYMKNWRYGTPTPEHAPAWQDLRGQRFGSLVVVSRASGAWFCRCDCGQTTRVRSGDLNRGGVTTCGDSRTHHRSPDAGYGAAHNRCKRDRGPASSHACVDCGQPAMHWSYNHDDPNEMYSTNEAILGVAYSLNPEHYSPRCVPCHKRFDLDRIDAAGLTLFG